MDDTKRQRAIDLYDRFTHEGMERRAFMAEMVKVAGSVAAAELLFVSYATRQHERKNALQHLHQEIALTKKHGSVTLEESLARLVREGVVEIEEAKARAAHPEEFENYLRGV